MEEIAGSNKEQPWPGPVSGTCSGAYAAHWSKAISLPSVVWFTYIHTVTVQVLARVPPSMLQGLASRTARHNSIYRGALTRHKHHHHHHHHLGRVDALLLGRPTPLVLASGNGHSYAPAVLTAACRHYAQQTPPGGGQGGGGGGGGIPGFRFPMQQQYAKGDALNEFVRVQHHLSGAFPWRSPE